MTADWGTWAQQIEDVSSLPEFQNASIVLYDPTQLPDLSAAEIYEGRARIIGIRAALTVGAGATENPTAVKRVRVQIPRGGHDDRIRQGTVVRVVDGGRNPALETLHVTVESDFQGSNSAARTLECIVAMDYATEAWTP